MTDYLTVAQVAEMFNLTPSAIRYWLIHGLIEADKVHPRKWRITATAVKEAREAGRIPPTPGRPRGVGK